MKQSVFTLLSFSMFSATLIGSGWAADPLPVFSEDFSKGQSALAKWKSKDLSLWTVDLDGALVGNNTTGAYGISARSPKFRQKDLRAAFRFKLMDAKGVQFKLNFSGGGHIGRMIIQPEGFFFQANKNRSLAITEAKNFDRFTVKVPKDVWHRFEIKLDGGLITATLNGQHSMTYQYEHLDNEIGSFELAVMGQSACFDDVVILAGGVSERQRTAAVGEKSVSPIGNGSPRPSMPSPKTGYGDAKSISKTVRVRNATPAESGRDTSLSKSVQPFFAANCNDCHGEGADEGGFELSSLAEDLSDAEVRRRWVLLFDRVKKGEMPPKDYGRPDPEQRAAALRKISSELEAAHVASREVVLRRLNRVEYENTVNDLFGIEMRLAEMLPEDASKYGFDNNGEALSLSSELIEIYLRAASQILDRAIGPQSEPDRIRISKTVRELVHDNMYSRWFKLLEREGGTVIYSSQFGAGSQLNFYRTKAEGTYRFRLHAKAWQSDTPVMMQIQSGILTRSGNKRFMGFYSVPPEGRIVEFTDYMSTGESIFPRPFGTIKNIGSFLQKGKRTIEEYAGPGLHVSKVEIEGPLEPWPPLSRTRLLGTVDLKNGTPEQAKEILSRFLPRAFRRPTREGEVEWYANKVNALMRSGRSFEESLRWALSAALCSPEFLFMEESGIGGNIDDFALANRLSYFLWSSTPDAGLSSLAQEKRLSDPEVLREQCERLLRSEKAKALTQNFAHQWLGLREIDATSPDTKLYPEFDEHLKASMVEETERFFEEVLRRNESVGCFIDSDWVVINERLARHYGIEGVVGNDFRRVTLPNGSVRGGVMTQASVLKITANGANTSPVTRGVWMLENVMGLHSPPPPPNVPAVVPDVTGANTLRQLLEKHRGEESCNSCHRLIDPPGFALEEFDAIGAFRQKYQFQGSRKLLPVDSSGITPHGDRFEGAVGYKRLVMKEIDQVAYGLTEKLMTYATGRGMGFSDRSELRSIVARSKESGYGFRNLIHQVVQSKLFRTP